MKGKEKGKGRQGGVGIPPVQRERVGVRRPRSAAPVWVSEKLVKWLPVVVPGVGEGVHEEEGGDWSSSCAEGEGGGMVYSPHLGQGLGSSLQPALCAAEKTAHLFGLPQDGRGCS